MKRVKQDVREFIFALQRGELTTGDAKRLADELEQEIVRFRRMTILLVMSVILLSTLLATVSLKKDFAAQRSTLVLAPEERSYQPYYTLPAEAIWVMEYQKVARDPELIATTNQSLTSKWVKNVGYHLIVGQQALVSKQYSKAVVHFEKVLTIFPEITGVQAALGTVYLRLGEMEEAVSHLKAAVEEEASFSALNNLGAALLGAGEFDQAENSLLQAQAVEPEHPSTYKNLALLYRNMEQAEKATSCFESYFSRYTEDADAMKVYAEYLIELNRREQAAEFLEAYCELHSEKALPFYLLLAEIEAQTTNSVKAVAALKNITRYISPNLALTKLHQPGFDSIRDSEAFRALEQQIELAMVTLENPQP